MQLVGVKRKYDEMEGVAEADETTPMSMTSSVSYPAQCQSVLNISMFKLRTPPCKKEPSLRRSVLIFNTLRYIEQELKQEGCKFMPPPPPIVFPPAEQDMTLDPPPPMDMPCPMEEGGDFSDSEGECAATKFVETTPSLPLACVDNHHVTCSSFMSQSDVLTTAIQCDIMCTMMSSSSNNVTPLPSISTLSSSCPLPPVTTFMESSAHRLTTSSCSSINLTSISDVLLNSVPVLNSTPVATPSKDGPLSPPSSSDSSMSQLFDLDTKVSSNSMSSQVLPPSNSDSDCTLQLRLPNVVSSHRQINSAHNHSGGYSSLIAGSFTATAAISMSPSSTGGLSLHGNTCSCTSTTSNPTNNNNTAFSDIDMSLYDFDLLMSAAPNVKVAPLSAEELVHSFPTDSYSGSIGPSPCYKTDFLGDDLDHIMQILVGI